MQRIEAMLERRKVADLFNCLAVDRDIFFFEDGHIGSVLAGNFLTGANEKTQKMLDNLLAEPYPPGTFLQDIQLGIPDLHNALEPYRAARMYAEGGNPIAGQACFERADFIERAATRAITSGVRTTIMDTLHYVAIKVPIKGFPVPREDELKDFRELRDRVMAMYEAASMRMTVLGIEGYLALMRRYLNMYGTWEVGYDDNELLRDQLAAPGARIKVRADSVRVDANGDGGRQHMGVLTVKRYPKRASIAVMDLMRGTPDGMGTQINMPYALTTTIHFPDQNAKIGKMRAKSVLVTQQAYGQMMKWVPSLRTKKEGFDVLLGAVDEGNNIVEINTTVTVFSKDPRALKKRMKDLSAMYQTFDFDMRPERFIVWPSIYNAMPLCPTVASVRNTHRFKTMASSQAARFLPVIDEWRGYGDAHLLVTRRGRTFSYDLFSPYNVNYNWTLTAKSGAGKSFAVQRMIQDYLALGTQIWIVDKRRSHAKFTRAHGGEYIEFTDEVFCSLNPFSEVYNIDESIGVLVRLLSKMCNPTHPTTDAENTRLTEAIKSVYRTKGRALEITHLWEYLNRQADDAQSKELAKRLYSFTNQGPYGSWFRGPNSFSPNAQLTTIEMAGLDTKPHLQQVIQQLVMIKVEAMMYQKDTAVRKMLIVEEGGDLMRDEGFSAFLAALYSKVRKESGSVGLILQSLSQLYGSKHGQSIAASSDTRIVMEQNVEAISAARKQEWTEMDDYEAAQLSGLHTVKGKAGYSELHFKTPGGSGVARLMEPRFNQVLFSTEGQERQQILDALDRGDDVIEAVRQFVDAETAAIRATESV
ncbi:TraC family protein [Noviherbaspirillum galbum]|uniref:TraC family protein n=1 Tax=Noviherbaspirillum galbum TaxID=2709383 RepID=A0A6B3SR36_9BURK|nr:TraC family protein [Noviherbaspirillum galbum]NEX63390.1 TraC family protein [Noviherbaspirillum galbum]